MSIPALSRTKKWHLDTARFGFKVGDLISEGDIFGTVRENMLLECRIFLPSYGIVAGTEEERTCRGGKITYIA